MEQAPRQEDEPLLANRASSNGGGYGSVRSRSGYALSQEGLCAMVAGEQRGFLDAFGGTSGVAAALGCKEPSHGLPDTIDLDAQRSQFGSNAHELPPEPSLCALLAEGIQDVTLVMLVCSACVSLFLGLVVERDYTHGWIEGVSILVTVALVLAVAALTDYSKAKEFRQQQIDLDNQKSAQVVRGGVSMQIHPRELVVGDVVRLAVGDILAADGVLLEAADLKMDESALTGETDLVPKGTYDKSDARSPSPFVVSGTNVMHGSGKMLVAAVGSNSMQGKILARLRHQGSSQVAVSPSGEGGDLEMGLGADGNCTAAVKSFFSCGGASEAGDLMEKLDRLAVDIGKGGMVVAVAVFIVMMARWTTSEWIEGGPCADAGSAAACPQSCSWEDGVCSRKWSATDLSSVLRFFITAITILVVAVPEGLPLAVTLSLAVSMRRMMKDNNQVKHMDSCETMGSATTICSDKTGTLTENKMTVMRARVAGHEYTHSAGSSTARNIAQVMQEAGMTKAVMRVVCEGVILDSMSTSRAVCKDGNWVYEGNATECALLKMADQLGYDAPALRKSFKEPGATLDWGVHAVPFSSERKRMSWVVRNKGIAASEPPFRLYSKGAPLELSRVCGKMLVRASQAKAKKDKDIGPLKVVDFSDADRQRLQSTMEEYQRKGMRTLALAYRDFPEPPAGGWAAGKTDIESDLVFVGLFGIEDPLRPSVPGAIARCRDAGIDVRMCTGDALTTAIAIASQCGILRGSDMVEEGKPKPNFAMTGAEFDSRVHRTDPDKPEVMRRVYDPDTGDAKEALAAPFLLDDDGNKVLDQAAFDEIWPKLRVLARCQPEDKLTLVRGMRHSQVFRDTQRCEALRREHNIHIFPDYQVVAVTGDGTNDAPALKDANVGFAMGIVGTETAKQACDIILLDDNFTSIVKAVMWGRNVFDSISKFIQFQLTVNVVAIVLAVVGAFTYNESPLSAVQMLWVNMIMDSLASLALATELPTEQLLERQPYGRRRPVISPIMMANIAGQGLYQLAVLLLVLFRPEVLPLDPPLTYEPRSGSMHWSFFFNVFVLLQLANEVNSRKLQTTDGLRHGWADWNVFEGALTNKIFVAVMASTTVLQVLIVQFGGLAVNLAKGGQPANYWLWALALAAGSFVWRVPINLGIMCCLPREKAAAARAAEDSPAPEGPEARWHAVRHHLRYGRIYARAFSMPLSKGVLLNDYIGTTKQTQMKRNALVKVARQLSHELSIANSGGGSPGYNT